MIQDILNLKPNVITNDLSSYNFLIYGDAGCGKTTLAVELFPKSIILGAEYGFKGINGAIGVSVPDFYTLMQYCEALDTDEAREKYNTIIVDTTTKIGEIIESYILGMYGKNTLGECGAFGKAYQMVSRLYNQCFNKLKARQYNFVYICHAKATDIKQGEEVLYQRYTPKMSDRLDGLITPEVDFVLFLTHDKNNDKVIISDNTPKNYAKRRIDLPLSIPLSAEVFKEEFAKGIEKKSKGNFTTEKKDTTVVASKEKERDYKVVVKEIQELGKKAKEKGILKEALDIVNKGLGTDEQNVQRTLDVVTQSNIEMLEVVKSQLEKLLA